MFLECSLNQMVESSAIVAYAKFCAVVKWDFVNSWVLFAIVFACIRGYIKIMVFRISVFKCILFFILWNKEDIFC